MLQGPYFDHMKSSNQQAFEAPMQTVWVDQLPGFQGYLQIYTE